MKKIILVFIILFVLMLIGISAYLILSGGEALLTDNQTNLQNIAALDATTTGAKWPTKNNSEGGLSIDITPISIVSNKPLKFEVAFNTHQGDLVFDLTKQAQLLDDKNNRYQPTEWQGGRGGHHLSGLLIFPPISPAVKQIKLRLVDIYGVAERTFEWDL